MMSAAIMDGMLVWLGTSCGAVAAALSTDASYQYLNAAVVFWIRILSAAVSAGCTAVLGYRSQTYGKMLADKERKEQGAKT